GSPSRVGPETVHSRGPTFVRDNKFDDRDPATIVTALRLCIRNIWRAVTRRFSLMRNVPHVPYDSIGRKLSTGRMHEKIALTAGACASARSLFDKFGDSKGGILCQVF